jgi:hypothetical protein
MGTAVLARIEPGKTQAARETSHSSFRRSVGGKIGGGGLR